MVRYDYDKTLTAQKICSINFILSGKKHCASIHDNGVNNYLLVNGVEIINILTKRFWNCSNFIMSRKNFKTLVSR